MRRLLHLGPTRPLPPRNPSKGFRRKDECKGKGCDDCLLQPVSWAWRLAGLSCLTVAEQGGRFEQVHLPNSAISLHRCDGGHQRCHLAGSGPQGVEDVNHARHAGA